MLTIRKVEPSSAELAALIEKLDRYLRTLYEEDVIFTVDFSDTRTADMTFAMAYWDGVPVGCGGIKPLGGPCAELKRFYVEPEQRRRGIAAQLLRFLESSAEEQGYTVLRLETGEPQFEAVAFYKKHGFYPIDRYGEYADCEESLCYEKKLR